MKTILCRTMLTLTVLTAWGCYQGEESAPKPPLEFDEATILRPTAATSTSPQRDPSTSVTVAAVGAAASPPYYVFGIGSGLSNADLTFVQKPGGTIYNANFTTSGNSFLEATYSARPAASPETLWTPNGTWLQSGALLDSEQTEIHFNWNMQTGATGFAYYRVELDYEVSSEENYDCLWINSTSFGNCNSPGVVQKKVSGQQSGHLSFQIDRSCGRGWVGIYYIKDYSVSRYGDYGRISNVKIYGDVPVGI